MESRLGSCRSFIGSSLLADDRSSTTCGDSALAGLIRDCCNWIHSRTEADGRILSSLTHSCHDTRSDRAGARPLVHPLIDDDLQTANCCLDSPWPSSGAD